MQESHDSNLDSSAISPKTSLRDRIAGWLIVIVGLGVVVSLVLLFVGKQNSNTETTQTLTRRQLGGIRWKMEIDADYRCRMLTKLEEVGIDTLSLFVSNPKWIEWGQRGEKSKYSEQERRIVGELIKQDDHLYQELLAEGERRGLSLPEEEIQPSDVLRCLLLSPDNVEP